MAATVVAALHFFGAAGVTASPRQSEYVTVDHDDPLIDHEVKRLTSNGWLRIHEETLALELEQDRRLAQHAHARGMTAAGAVFATGGLILWTLEFWSLVSSWLDNRAEERACRNSYDDLCNSEDFAWLTYVIAVPPAAFGLFLGAPLLVGGLTRSHLTDHPGDAPRLRKIGGVLALSGAGVLVIGLLSMLPVYDTTNHSVGLPLIIGTNLSIIGATLGLSGLAMWAEARRAIRIRRTHERDVGPPRKIAFDPEVRARENAQRRTGLPRARIWSYAVRF